MQASRRIFLRRITLAGGAILSLGNRGLCLAQWPAGSFEDSAVGGAIDALLQGAPALISDAVTIVTPEEHQNPALVPVSVTTRLRAVSVISLLSDSTELPLLADFAFNDHPINRISTRIRVEKSARVWAVVESEDQYYISRDFVQIIPFRSDQ